MKFFLILLVATSGIAHAQTLVEPESKSYYADGINFEHAPTSFKTRFQFRVQSRATYASEDNEVNDDEFIDLAVRRLRIRMDGSVLDSRFLYRIQLSFTRGDMDYDRTEYPNILRDAVVGWKLTDNTKLWYGQTKLPGNRQRVISSGAQQFVDRSILNQNFNIDRDLGAQSHTRLGEERPFWVKLAITNGGGRATENKNTGLSYTSRVEWLPLGDFKNFGDYFEGDLEREITPKLSIGASYSINKEATRPGGQIGVQYSTPGLARDIETWFIDSLVKYRGFSWSTEYARRWTDDPVFEDQGAENIVSIFKGHGINTQVGYLLENNIETALRFTQLVADRDALLGSINNQKQYTLAISKYFDNHAVKLQSDISYDERSNHRQNFYASSWIYRLQLELGI